MSNTISSVSSDSINSMVYMIMQQGIRPTDFSEELSEWAQRFDSFATPEEKQVATNTIRTELAEGIYPHPTNFPIFKSRIAEFLNEDGELFRIMDQEISTVIEKLQDPTGHGQDSEILSISLDKSKIPSRKSFKVQYTLTGVIGFSELDTPGAVEERVKSFLEEEESINLDMFSYSQEILEEKPL